MEKKTFDAPALYADHHVSEVRRLLTALPGVKDVYASSAFYIIEVTYDPDKISPDKIEEILRQSGYLDELPLPQESGTPVTQGEKKNGSFRHTATFEQTPVIAFKREISLPYRGRPLWPCPGFGVLKVEEDE
ncbi:MAG: copper chaperone [Anaerolineae bacterium]|nr:MAG: copper chaperone [Anaerolineae bacterium]